MTGRTMTGRTLISDDRGAVTTDWVALTAGILLLGMIVVMSVMENSAGYLMSEFEELNERYKEDGVAVSELRGDLSRNLRN